MPVIDNFCLTCTAKTAFEQLPCTDGHGSDCPEWLCSRCGAAVLVGFWPSIAAPRQRRRARAA